MIGQERLNITRTDARAYNNITTALADRRCACVCACAQPATIRSSSTARQCSSTGNRYTGMALVWLALAVAAAAVVAAGEPPCTDPVLCQVHHRDALETDWLDVLQQTPRIFKVRARLLAMQRLRSRLGGLGGRLSGMAAIVVTINVSGLSQTRGLQLNKNSNHFCACDTELVTGQIGQEHPLAIYKINNHC